MLALTVTGASAYRPFGIIHDAIKREGKQFEGEEKDFVRRCRESLWRVIVYSAEAQYLFAGLDHKNESDYGPEHEKSDATWAC